MNGKCDICKEPITTQLHKQKTIWKSQLYCDDCWINEKKCIEARERFYKKIQDYNDKVEVAGVQVPEQELITPNAEQLRWMGRKKWL